MSKIDIKHLIMESEIDHVTPPCPGRVRVSEGYTWYVRATDNDPTLFTMCGYCYNALPDDKQTLYKLYDDQAELTSVNCDSQYSIDNATTLYKCDGFRIRVSVITEDTKDGSECQFSDADGVKCFNVPTGLRFEVGIETQNPEEYISYSSAAYDTVAYVTYNCSTPVLYHSSAVICPPTASWTPSQRERLENPSAFAGKTGIFKVVVQRWRRRTEDEKNEDVIPLAQYVKIGEETSVSFLLKSSQSEEELYEQNTKKFCDEQEAELISWHNDLEFTQAQVTSINNALAKGRADFAESVEKFVARYGRQPNFPGSTQLSTNIESTSES